MATVDGLTHDERIAVMRHLIRELDGALPVDNRVSGQASGDMFRKKAQGFAERLDRLAQHLQAIKPEYSP